MSNYEVIGIDQSNTHFSLFTCCDLVTFENVIKEIKWQMTLDDEIMSLRKTIHESR